MRRNAEEREKIGLVDMGFLLTGQRTRYFPPVRQTVDFGRQHRSEKTEGEGGKSPGVNFKQHPVAAL